MNKWKTLLALVAVSLLAAYPAHSAGDPFAIFDDIDAMMEDNALMEASNRYESIMLTFFPERATLLGFESANTQLDTRTPARDQAALLALQSLQTAIKEMHGEKFSPAKRTDYALLKARVNYEIWQLNRNRLTTDPLYYTQAYDAVYDLLLKRLSLQTRQNEALSARSAALAQTATEARQNLKAPSAFLAQLAMEKAYYAYLAYEQVSHRLQTQAQDDLSRQDAVKKTNIARKNLKNMFEYFKALSQQEETPDFRLGEKDYLFVLQNKYFITDSPSALRKAAQRRLLEARKNLQEALEPFTVSADEEAEVITEDGSAPVKKAKKKKHNKKAPLPTAADFYTIKNRLALDASTNNILFSIAQEARNAADFLADRNAVKAFKGPFNVQALPAYFAYMQAYKFVPPYGAQNLPTDDFFVRLPTGNALAKHKMAVQDLNPSARKLMIAGELVPGRYYKSVQQNALGGIRKRYGVPTLNNGWSVYAQHTAQEAGYIITDTDNLFLAFEDYRRAAAAAVDVNLHLGQFSYADAMTFLTQANGFEKEEAEKIIKSATALPGEALSYPVGYETLKTLRQKYQKKQGARFNAADFNARVLGIGDIPPAQLSKALEEAYKNKK